MDPDVVATLLAPHAIGSLGARAVGPWVLDPPRLSDLLLGQLDGSLELVEEPATTTAPTAARSFRLTGWIEAAPRRDVEVTSGPGTWTGSELRWRARWLRTVRLRVAGEVRRDAAGTEGLSWQLRSDVECACEQELGVPMLAIELALRWSGTLRSEGEATPKSR